MSGPWEDYATTEAGPWEDYAASPLPQNDATWAKNRDKFIDDTGTLKTRAKEKALNVGRNILPSRQTIAKVVRPTLEGLGAVGGGIVGTTAGPVGTLAGAGLGYAIGKNITDTIEGDYAATPVDAGKRALSDIGTGTTYEMGGAVAGNLIGRGAKAITKQVTRTPLKDMAENRAREVFEANKALTPTESANTVKAKKLTDALNVKLTPAQMTGKPSLASLEQNLATTDPTFAAQLNAQDSAAKQAALAKIRQSVGPGRPAPVTQDVQTTGGRIIESVQNAQKAAKPIHEELYDAIPNTPQPTGKIRNVINMLKRDFRPGDEDVFPSRAISRVEEAIAPAKQPKPTGQEFGANDIKTWAANKQNSAPPVEVGFQDLHSLRKDIGRQIQDASTGMKPNRELAAKLTTIKNAIDETIEESMGADNQYKAAKDAFIDYAGKYRTGAVNKVLAKGNESTGLRIAEENVPRQFFTPSGVDGLIKAVGKTAATNQMKPFVVSDMVKSASPDGVNFNVQAGVNYIQKNRVVLERLGLVKDAQQVIRDQFPKELERMLLKRALDATGNQFFTSQDMRGILQKYGNTIKQLYGADTLNSFRAYNELMGIIERKNLIPRSGGSNTAEKALSVANSMIASSVGPSKKLTDGLLGALAQGAGLGTGASVISGGVSAKTAAIGALIMAGRQAAKNANSQVSKAFVSILQEATLNPQVASDLMKLQRTGKVPATLQTIIDKRILTGAAAGIDN